MAVPEQLGIVGVVLEHAVGNQELYCGVVMVVARRYYTSSYTWGCRWAVRLLWPV